MNQTIDTAMILAAGFGKRMNELTKDTPKPMLELNGQSIITRLIDKLMNSGISRIIINLHYKADLLEAHITDHVSKLNVKPKIIFSHETEILETGGGIFKALKIIDRDKFIVLNSDIYWEDTPDHTLLADFISYSQNKTSVLCITPIQSAMFYENKGDFEFTEGFITESENKNYILSGIYIVDKNIFSNVQKVSAFRIMDIFWPMIRAKDLQGFISANLWFHVGTQESLRKTNDYLLKIS